MKSKTKYFALIGGLGNQLFIYSLAKYIEKYNFKIIFDISNYKSKSVDIIKIVNNKSCKLYGIKFKYLKILQLFPKLLKNIYKYFSKRRFQILFEKYVVLGCMNANHLIWMNSY